MSLLLKPKNVQIKESFFREEHFRQVREMHRMLSYAIEDIATRSDVPMRDLALRQDAREANLRYKNEVYGPLHTELHALCNAFEAARNGEGPYPQWIGGTGEVPPLLPDPLGLTFACWPAFKKEFRYFGALTVPARARCDEILRCIAVFHAAVEDAREAACDALKVHVINALEHYAERSDYRRWHRDIPLLPGVSYAWFEWVEKNVGPDRGQEVARAWLRRSLLTFGWLPDAKFDQAARCVFDEYQRVGANPPDVEWFLWIFLKAFQNRTFEAVFRTFWDAKACLVAEVSQMEEALLNALINIQYVYEGGAPPL